MENTRKAKTTPQDLPATGNSLQQEVTEDQLLAGPQNENQIDWRAALDATDPTQLTPYHSPIHKDPLSSKPRQPLRRLVPQISTSKSNRPKSRAVSIKPPTGVASFGATLQAGPWLSAFLVQTGFALKSKSNFRRYGANKRVQGWAELSGFEKDLSDLLLLHRPATWNLLAAQPLNKRPVAVMTIIGRTTHDASNLSKSVLDAAEGVLFANDASVRFVTESSIRTKHLQSGIIATAILSPDATLEQIMQSGSALVSLVASCITSDGFINPASVCFS